jgi:hypothetical protein
MNKAYLLMHNGDPLGIFDSPGIPDQQIYNHFGDFVYERKVDFQDVRDSGIEWVLRIYVDHKHEELTMMYFGINEI